MTTNTQHELEAGAIVEFPDATLGWVHLEEYGGLVCCYRVVDLGDDWNEMALYTPDALTVILPPPLAWNEGRHAFESHSITRAIKGASRLSAILDMLYTLRADDQRPGWWLVLPTRADG